MSIQLEERYTSAYLEGVKTLIQGDQANGSDTCAVIGVDDTTKDTQFFSLPMPPK